MRDSFFSANRDHCMDSVKGGVIVVSAYSRMQRGNDAASLFEQEANFWYLTGLESPDWWVIITQEKSWLVAPVVDEVHRVFNGGLTFEEAKRISGIDTVISRREATKLLAKLAKKYSVVYTVGSDPNGRFYDFVLNPTVKQMHTLLKKIFINVKDCRPQLTTLRALKQPAEIMAMRKAIDLTVMSFEQIKKQFPHLTHEYEIEAEFSYYFRKNGAQGHAYDPIVAGGKNACTLHYSPNEDSLSSDG